MSASATANGHRATAERARTPRPPKGYDRIDQNVLHVAGFLMCGECGDLVANVVNATQRHTWGHTADRAREDAEAATATEVAQLRERVVKLARRVDQLSQQADRLETQGGI